MNGKGGVIVKIINVVMIVISFAAILALIASYISPFVNPNHIWYFALFGLIAPIIYIANLVIALYWACRWNPMFFLTAFFLMIGVGNISMFYRASISKSYPAAEQKNSNIKIFTFNVEGFIALNENRKSYSTAGEILNYIKEWDPDIICFQEYQSTKLFPQAKIDEELSLWPYKTINYSTAGILGTALYSKFPIISSGIIEFENSNNSVIYSNLAITKKDTLRVINNHLETTYIDKGNLAFLEYRNLQESDNRKGEIIQIGLSLKKGFQRRAIQADSVATLISSSSLPTVVCGDFNDTPLSYVYRKIRGDYKDSFEEKGAGMGYTYKHLYRILRIDYILHSDDIETVNYESPNVKWSDHNPVTASVKIKR